MKLEYWTEREAYYDDAVTSLVGSGLRVQVYTADFRDHHKYLIDGDVLKKYEETCDFYTLFRIRNWRVVA